MDILDFIKGGDMSSNKIFFIALTILLPIILLGQSQLKEEEEIKQSELHYITAIAKAIAGKTNISIFRALARSTGSLIK